ncbi:MAG TPA: hypothetical protein VGQ39_23745 [Pyrinomonadaceae bacterium]|nr:hypothetical protein [Pyrinomonadaceae bacterium]
MAKQNSFSLQENVPTELDVTGKTEPSQTAKKQFIEPAISMPVDVLEATTFFQVATSGGTN